MRRWVALLTLNAALVISVQGQDCCTKVEAFVGYSYFNASPKTDRIPPNPIFNPSVFGGRIGQHGFGVNVAGRVRGKLGLVGDISYQTADAKIFNVNTDTSTFVFLAGSRLSMRNDETTLFAQALIGGARRKADNPNLHITATDLALSFGAGLDIGFRKRFAFRVFEFDYLPSRGSDALTNIGKRWSQNFRAQSGFVFRFGN